MARARKRELGVTLPMLLGERKNLYKKRSLSIFISLFLCSSYYNSTTARFGRNPSPGGIGPDESRKKGIIASMEKKVIVNTETTGGGIKHGFSKPV
jgi:hypothetical protein